MTDAAQGCFLYARWITTDLIEEGRDDVDAARLPDGLQEVFEDYLASVADNLPDAERELTLQVLGLLAVAESTGLPRRLLVELTDQADDTAVTRLLEGLRRVLVGGHKAGRRLFHPSFGRVLFDTPRQVTKGLLQALPLNPLEWHRRLAHHAVAHPDADGYMLHGVDHEIAAAADSNTSPADRERLEALVSTFKWFDRRLTLLGTGTMIADLDPTRSPGCTPASTG